MEWATSFNVTGVGIVVVVVSVVVFFDILDFWGLSEEELEEHPANSSISSIVDRKMEKILFFIKPPV